MSRIERRSDQFISLTRFQLICCLLHQSSLSFYHVFCNRVNESSNKFRHLSVEYSISDIVKSFINAFNQRTSDNFFVNASDNFFVNASDNFFLNAFDQCVLNKFFRQCIRQVLRQSANKSSRVRNHQTSSSSVDIILLKFLILLQCEYRYIRIDQQIDR